MESKMKIGYIAKYDLKLNPHLKGRFEFKEATYTRKINSRGDKIYSKLLAYPFDYEEVADNADIMKKNDSIILVQEPFLLDDELREKVIKWVEWANQADPKECHVVSTVQMHINNKIRELHTSGCEVIDVKYSFTGDEAQQNFAYTAMIVYKTQI